MRVLYKHHKFNHFGLGYWKGIMPKIIQCTCNTPFKVYDKSFGSITYLEIIWRVLHNHTKT
jgi:hypothetical protein